MVGNLISSFVRWYRAKPVDQRDQIRLRDRVMTLQMGPFHWLESIPVALLFGRNLRMLASIYMSDKWNFHWYAQHYEEVFRKDRRKRLNVLEIGIGGYDDPQQGGGSLRMWRSYFPHARIYGADIYDKSPHNQSRIQTFQGSQADPVFLDSVVGKIGRLDIVVDDGSHVCEHILFTFQHLFPLLAEGGLYVIEDTQTSYCADFGGNELDRNDPNTSIGYFKSLVDGLNWEEFSGHYSPTYLDLNITSIAFYHNLIFIRKGSNRERDFPPRKIF
jgi:hypothetical protein